VQSDCRSLFEAIPKSEIRLCETCNKSLVKAVCSIAVGWRSKHFDNFNADLFGVFMHFALYVIDSMGVIMIVVRI
jgi:hypothetical protein